LNLAGNKKENLLNKEITVPSEWKNEPKEKTFSQLK